MSERWADLKSELPRVAISRLFDARLAHVHGNLFVLLNVVVGVPLLLLPLGGSSVRWISRLALVGLLMPIGILAEGYLETPPLFVLLGGVSMLAGTAWRRGTVARLRLATEPESEATR